MKTPSYLTEKKIQKFIKNALQEDIGQGDYTSLSIIPEHQYIQAHLLIKDNGILAGIQLAKAIYIYVDPTIVVNTYKKDGDYVTSGQKAFVVHGQARAILSTERLVLNCIQRMSGIATYTNHLKKKIQHTSIQILDTRKTTPNARIIEKWAVYIGGGTNHRYGLDDKILIKDNHIDIAGSIAQAIQNTQKYLQKNKLFLAIEVEARTLSEVKEIIQHPEVDTIMLDNMDQNTIKQAIALVNGQYKVEISGGVTEKNIAKIAACPGIDAISVGALTHTVKNLDMSLKIML